MTRISNAQRAVAVIFIIILFLIFIKSGSYTIFENVSDYLKQDFTDEQAITMNSIEEEYVSSMSDKQKFVDFNGFMARIIGIQGYYSDIGIYVTDDKYIVSKYNETSTDYECEQIISFKNFLDENGINLLYVNEPIKYIDDDFFADQFGIATYSNRNVDLFLKRIGEAGISYIDLRESLINDGMDIGDMFYRTDHHWTVPSGLWASGKIAEGLNQFCGYSIDLSLYDKSRYTFIEYENSWLGEQGRKVGVSYVGLDDFIEVKPNFSTSFSFKSQDGLSDGTFDNFIDETVYNAEQDIYEDLSWHYSYMRRNVINNDVDYGKLLILGDSYEEVTEPFVALGVSEVDMLELRYCGEGFSLRDYILENGYDTVIICYAQFMIGAHDNVKSSNYNMFTFE